MSAGARIALTVACAGCVAAIGCRREGQVSAPPADGPRTPSMPGALFVALPGKGLLRFQDNRITTVAVKLPGPDGTLHDLTRDGEGALWTRYEDAAHKADGLYVRHQDAWVPVAGPPGEDHQAGRCRLASAGGGDVHLVCARAIYRRSAAQTWTKIGSREPPTAPAAAAVQRDGTIYVASPREIVAHPPGGERPPQTRFPSPVGRIAAVAVDERKRIWLLDTWGDLAVLDGAGDALVVPEPLAGITGATSLFVEGAGPEEPRRKVLDGSHKLTGKLKGIDLDGAVATLYSTVLDEDRHRTTWDIRLWRQEGSDTPCSKFETDEVELSFETPYGATEPIGKQRILHFSALRKGNSYPFAEEDLAVPGQAEITRFGRADSRHGQINGVIRIDVKLRDGKSRATGETAFIDCQE